MVKNDCVTDWRHLFSVFIWLLLSIWMWSVNGIIRVLWGIKAETRLMHHADVSYTWNMWVWCLNRSCVSCVGLLRQNDIRETTMSTVFTLKSALGFTKTKIFFFFWRLASLLDRGNESDRKKSGWGHVNARNESVSLMSNTGLQYSSSTFFQVDHLNQTHSCSSLQFHSTRNKHHKTLDP